MSDKQVIDALAKGVGVYSVVLAVVGTIGNAITAGVCLRKNIRNTPTLIFTAFIALSDVLPLVTYNLNPLNVEFFSILLTDLSGLSCKLLSFFHFWGIHTSAYLLVANAFDRFMSVRLILWRKLYFNSKRAILVSVFIITAAFLLNLHILIGNDYNSFKINGTLYFRCAAVGTIRNFYTWDQYVSTYVPFAFLVAFNILLLHTLAYRKLTKSTSSQVLSKKQRALNVSIIASTLAFIITKTPVTLFTGFFSPLILTRLGSFLVRLFGAIQYTNCSSNLFIQLSFNSVFSKEFKSLFFKESSEIQTYGRSKTNLEDKIIQQKN